MLKQTGFSKPPTPSIPARIGRFSVVQVLGHGSTGTVYLAHDPIIDRNVAVKTFNFQMLDSQKKKHCRHFINEARAAGRLSHPGIVTVFEALNEGDTTYVAMEYLQGKELSKLLASGHRFDHKEIALVIKRLAQALGYAHQNDVVHRDIKPANIFMLENNQPKIVDFGIARAPNRLPDEVGSADSPYTLFQNNVMGTPNYMSPEQALGKPADSRSDIYSLGVVMYELLTGQRPFDSKGTERLLHQVAYKLPPSPHDIDSAVPLVLSQIAMKAMSKRPDNRYQEASEMLKDIKRYLVQESRHRAVQGSLSRGNQKNIAIAAPRQADRMRLFLLSCLAIVSAGAMFYMEWSR